MAGPLRILHLHSSFSLGGKEARATRLMNAFGDAAHHVVLSAMPKAMDARTAVAPDIAVGYPQDAPALHGKPGPLRYVALARYMQRFDLVLSYNWGAMDGVMAHRLLARAMHLPPLVHHEDGFNADESVRLNPKRNAFRRIALPTAHAVAVPSHTLEQIARAHWGAALPVTRIANGIPIARYAAPPPGDVIPGFVRRSGDVVIGTIAGLRAVKDLPRLVAAFATLPGHCRLVIVGSGPEAARIANEALLLGVSERVHMPGFMDRPWRYVGLFDILALSSLSEQQPIAVIEAMAAGLPVAAPDVGDIAQMVAAENRPYIAGNGRPLRDALAQLAGDAALRQIIGAANQRHAAATYDESVMIARYAALYDAALGGAGLLAQAVARKKV